MQPRAQVPALPGGIDSPATSPLSSDGLPPPPPDLGHRPGEKPDAGWSSPVARRAHNPKVRGSNPLPATTEIPHVFLEATVTTNLGQVQVYDAFVMRDGKVAYHFTGVK